ncbi:diguanylate cyclase/phosphodiesterase [Pseudacidovorax intermedius]|uniref:Diguanylate cyclase/phosphodiesterase n=1 Tax=Pseudacidovorax intermedius TaxID=433924 RepID=A0A370FEF2_9BURK|nr:EAL domain-containing protein [Pseudacidovorax intermedius]RDI22777.1 diguanylate cyclase/phosphodiesterase [Pseudacidovorax intermedius]
MTATMASTYDPLIVAASVALSIFVAFVALDLGERVHTRDRLTALIWCAGGALVMGTGIWAVHFVGMMAHSLPVSMGYSYGFTGLSWLLAVLTAAVTLLLARARRLAWPQLAGGSALMAIGFLSMHQIGMLSLDMSPGVSWNLPLIGLATLLVWLASATTLRLFFRRREGSHARAQQLWMAVGLGAAMIGTHYMGMASASYAEGSVCLSAEQLGGDGLVLMVIAATVLMQVLTLVTAMLDARLRGQTRTLHHSLERANHQLQEANDELDRRAVLDPLTGLPTRAFFDERLASARTGGVRKLAVLFVDLDGFKPVNDSFGHACGDKVLREVADRLRRVLRSGDTVARVGGDEFVALMEDVAHPADCSMVAGRILDELARPFTVGEPPVQISASIGMAMYPDHARKGALVAHADAAMRAAKRAGGRQYAFFEPHMSTNAHEQLSLQTELRQALERGELVLHYQPKIDCRRRELAGVEALVRWNHPVRGTLGPSTFIPVAERFGLIGQLGQWVIEEACRQMKDWARVGMPMRVAINLSAQQLHEADLVERIDAALRRHGVAASQLLCEITETVTMEDVNTTQEVFGRLARIGVFIAIDDFGTGYSSLSYLRRLPARQLKIDRSFISDLETSADARAVVDAVVRLAHALGLRVVAEGVETAGQRDILVGMNCDELQGYFFARPMPADQLVAWSRRRPSLARV